MKLLFAESADTDELTFKRRILFGNEITFVERPSIQFIKDFATGRSF